MSRNNARAVNRFLNHPLLSSGARVRITIAGHGVIQTTMSFSSYSAMLTSRDFFGIARSRNNSSSLLRDSRCGTIPAKSLPFKEGDIKIAESILFLAHPAPGIRMPDAIAAYSGRFWPRRKRERNHRHDTASGWQPVIDPAEIKKFGGCCLTAGRILRA